MQNEKIFAAPIWPQLHLKAFQAVPAKDGIYVKNKSNLPQKGKYLSMNSPLFRRVFQSIRSRILAGALGFGCPIFKKSSSESEESISY
jgi:hypothetical protein